MLSAAHAPEPGRLADGPLRHGVKRRACTTDLKCMKSWHLLAAVRSGDLLERHVNRRAPLLRASDARRV
jgi:hypothetical protein